MSIAADEDARACEQLGHVREPGDVVVDPANPTSVTPDIIYDENGGNPVKVWNTVVLSPDGSTQVYITVDPSQFAAAHQEVSVGNFTGAQLFGICDKWGNPRAGLELRPFAGAPGEAVRLTIAVDDLPPAVINIGTIPGVAMEYPAPKGDGRRFVHLLPEAAP